MRAKQPLVEISPGMWVDPDEVFIVQRAVDNQSGHYKLGYSMILTMRGVQLVARRVPAEVAGIINGTVEESALTEPAAEPELHQIDRPGPTLADQRLDGKEI